MTRRMGARSATPEYEAALNLLREELRAVNEVHRTILRDHDLEASDPSHRGQLLAQTRREASQITRALGVLDRLERGELIEVLTPATMPALGQWGVARGELRTSDVDSEWLAQ